MVGDKRGSEVSGETERKGRAPVGEAWLFDATMVSSISTNLRYAYGWAKDELGRKNLDEIRLTCHFRQLGLNDGLPAFAASSVANTYRIYLTSEFGRRCGSSFAG